MHLEGSCHCGAVRFSLEAPHPYPYLRCYCSICRKTGGGGGYAINLGGLHDTLKIRGEEHIRDFHAHIGDGDLSPGERRFCGKCGSALWVWDPRWPDLVHPFASAIDTPLPEPPQVVHIMLDYAVPWVRPDIREGDLSYGRYPEESLAEWHQRQGLEDA